MVEAEIYLDAAATTPPRSEVIDVVVQVQQAVWANPSSLHVAGLKAAELLERSRWKLARRFVVSPEQLVVTSGATESVHLGLLGSAAALQPSRIVVSAVEHPAVLAASEQLKKQGWTIAVWPVDATGHIRLELMDQLLAPPTRLVSLIAAQSEVGTLQPVACVGKACRERGIVFHSDATQLIPQGCPQFNSLNVDLLSLSAHKFQGPRGIGLLIRRPTLAIQPLQSGGGQEFGLRSGTEPVALIAGMVEALSALPTFCPEYQSVPPGSGPNVRQQRDRLLQSLLKIPGFRLVGPDVNNRLPNHIAVLAGTDRGYPISARSMVRELAHRGVACSSGSACSSGKRIDSPILSAMGVAKPWRQSGLRFTLGPWLDDVALDLVPDVVNAAQRSLS
ncbi:aminotransferase class V-fold PLP-dependent enzyme [Synechococcus sp. M16CYN]|uniref:cysteine desulfurase family protein n=1 Tax=Synechococcus sp. M16CYN TaxID=3103139 RepID=UPI0032479F76